MAQETNTHKALIMLHGLPFDEAKPIANVQFSSDKYLMDYLKELQLQYCLDDLETGEKDTPKIESLQVPSKRYPGKLRTVYNCFSYSDWHYAAHLGVSYSSVELIHLL